MPLDKASGAKPAGPCSMVIFGAGGDLTKRLVVPALYNLACSKLLPDEFCITGVDRADQSSETWHNTLLEMTRHFVASGKSSASDFNQDVWNWLISRMSYFRGDLNDPAMYESL